MEPKTHSLRKIFNKSWQKRQQNSNANPEQICVNNEKIVHYEQHNNMRNTNENSVNEQYHNEFFYSNEMLQTCNDIK